MKLMDLVMWSTIILTSALGIYLLYYVIFDPFGPSSRCRKVKTIESKGFVAAKLFVIDGNMTFGMARRFLEDNGHEVLDLKGLRRLVAEESSWRQLPCNSRIIGEHDGALWALDTGNLVQGACRVERIDMIETPSSLEDCLIAAQPCT